MDLIPTAKIPKRGASSSLQVPFGLHGGKLVEPLQVPLGTDCDCSCPGCGGPLIAKHAAAGKMTPHFAHAANTGCEGGLESALHLAAKQLIEERQELVLPPLNIEVTAYGMRRTALSRSALLHPGGTVHLSRVQVEKAIGKIRPDLVVHGNEFELLVEIAFTHFVDETKLAFIRNQGIAAIEVDISDLTVIDFTALAQRLFVTPSATTWLFHPDAGPLKEALEIELRNDLSTERLEWSREQAALKAQADIEAREKAQLKISNRPHTVKHGQKEQARRQRTAEFAALSNEQKLSRVLRYLGIEMDELPSFLTMEVRASRGTSAQPRVWQAAVFASLIHTAIRRKEPQVNVECVLDWLAGRFQSSVVGGRGSPTSAVKDYLSSLEKLAILHRHTRSEFLVATADFSAAKELALDHRTLGRLRQRWRKEWPSREQTETLADVFSTIHGSSQPWTRLPGLLPSVRENEEPLETIMYYMSGNSPGIGAAELRRFFLSVGFTELARP
ncbi:competence protein CoiA family protein [Aquabacterium sp.]|uniref:competence protein CoiA family protein n=1 Tax=Aquabacterium sp. TaxID=1872578 RepID=UPI00248A6CD4|nr:competence protein CoiA family protein [Aquabacterium sp.]MDI1258260.1 competence protein CoiA family protein [Aquabacterium sp.]